MAKGRIAHVCNCIHLPLASNAVHDKTWIKGTATSLSGDPEFLYDYLVNVIFFYTFERGTKRKRLFFAIHEHRPSGYRVPTERRSSLCPESVQTRRDDFVIWDYSLCSHSRRDCSQRSELASLCPHQQRSVGIAHLNLLYRKSTSQAVVAVYYSPQKQQNVTLKSV